MNHCGKRFASESSVKNHQKQLSSTCWKSYSILLQVEAALSLSAGTSEDVQLLPSTPLLMPSSPSSSVMEVNMMDTIDTMAAMDSMSAAEMNDQSDLDDQYPNQDTIPSIYTELFPGASDIFGKGETFIDLFDGNEYAES